MMGRGRHGRRRDKAPARGSGRARGARALPGGHELPDARERWLDRHARGLRPDRNPLRRRIDRVEAYLLAGMFVAAAVGAPLAAQAGSEAAHASALRVQQEQLTTRHQVTATLTQPAGPAVDGYALSVDVPTKASWTAVGGGHRSATVLALAGTPRGARVTIWTDPSGDLVSPPMTVAQVAGQGDAGAVGALVGVLVMFLTATGVVRHVLYRRRMAAWEADWLVTAPTWNRQSW